jgi:hypothetical protein
MSDPKAPRYFNSPHWLAENFPENHWLNTWRVKRRFEVGSPKYGYAVSEDIPHEVLISMNYGVPGWDNGGRNPFAYVIMIFKSVQTGTWVTAPVGTVEIPALERDQLFRVATGQAMPGTWVGIVLKATGGGVRTDILGYYVPEEEETQPPYDGDKGADWYWRGGKAPIVVMTPTGEMSDAVWDLWINRYQEIVLDPGWDGTHTPLQGVVENDYFWEMAHMNQEHGLITAVWITDQVAGYEETKAATTDFILRLEEEGLEHWVIIGPTYDVQEYWSTDEVNEWVDYVESIAPYFVLIGARALPDREYKGDYEAYEDHVPNLSDLPHVLDSEIARSEGDPIWNTERFRVRNSGAGKDWVEVDFGPAIEVLREKNVGAIFGIQEPRGSVSDYGSGPPTSIESLNRIREALTGDEQVPEPEDSDMYDIADHRNYRAKIADATVLGSEYPTWAQVWDHSKQFQDLELVIPEDVAIMRIEYFFGVIRGMAEE